MSDSYEDFAYVAPERKRRRWPSVLLISALTVNVISASFAWWAIGLSVEAATSFSPEPSTTRWIWFAIVTFLASSLLALFSAIVVIFHKNFSH